MAMFGRKRQLAPAAILGEAMLQYLRHIEREVERATARRVTDALAGGGSVMTSIRVNGDGTVQVLVTATAPGAEHAERVHYAQLLGRTVKVSGPPPECPAPTPPAA